MARKRLQRRFRRRRSSRSESRPSPKHNPPLFTDLAEFIAPGFAGFAATRFLTYVATNQVAKRKPDWGKHAGAGVSVGAFLAAWYLAGKVKYLAKYQTPLVVGAGIAALQTLIQLYIPKLGWMVGDPTAALEGSAVGMLSATSGQQFSPNDLQVIDDDPSLYTYNDSYDAGRYGRSSGANGQPQGVNPGSPDVGTSADVELDDTMGSAVNLGVFS